MNFEIALVVYDDHHEFRDLPFENWTIEPVEMISCGVVLDEDEKWLRIVSDYDFEHRDKMLPARNVVQVIFKSAISYEQRFRVRDCPPVDGMLTAFRHQEEEMP